MSVDSRQARRLPPLGRRQPSAPLTPQSLTSSPASPDDNELMGRGTVPFWDGRSPQSPSSCSSWSSGGSRGSRGGRWADPGACDALCLLILDDRRSSGAGQRRPLPPALYAENVAPFLRFDEPLPDMVYALGGRNQSRGPLDTVEMLDTWRGQWTACAPMPTRRAGSAAASLPDGRLVVIGGYDQRGIAEGLLGTCDVYDPFTQSWEKSGIPNLKRARWGHGCASLGGKIYVAGGCSLQPNAQPREAFMETLRCCEVYDPAENRWSMCAPLQIGRSGFRIVALEGDRYLAAVGGCDNVFGRAETQPTVELYDSVLGQWSLLETRLSQPRTTAAAVAIGGGDILVMGGAPSLSTTEIYHVAAAGRCGDEERGGSATSASMPEGRMGCQAAVIPLPKPGGAFPLTCRPSVVVVGGERCEEGGGDIPRVNQFASVPVYDIETGKWREDGIVPPMAGPRTAVALCVGKGRVTA
uniref:Uncharacterized protein n=1 Tax=Alexandrium catenella TaxID=2925 RepID=A0A7S1SCW5_ALECA